MAGCKCKKCQAALSTSKAHRVENGKRGNMYFCNEEHYHEWLNKQEEEQKKKDYDQQMKDRFYYLFCDILGVKGITHTSLWKEKAEINAVFPDEVIAAYLEENKTWLTEAVSKSNSGIYGKIRYVCTILKNQLGDFQAKANETPKPKVQVEETIYVPEQVETAPVKSNKRRSLADLEDEY